VEVLVPHGRRERTSGQMPPSCPFDRERENITNGRLFAHLGGVPWRERAQ
jgi:hypothetical protein